jgi:hypothetical protein
VSHGWTGTDQSYVTKLRQCIDRYQVYRPEVADPQSEPTDTTDTSRENVDSYRQGLAHASLASAELFYPQFRKKTAKEEKAAGDGAPRAGLIRLRPGMLAQEQSDGTFIEVTATGEVAAPAQVDDTGTRTVPVRRPPQTAPAAPKQVVVLPTPPKPKPVPQRTSQPPPVLLDATGGFRNFTQEVLRANSRAYNAQKRRRPTK